MTNTNHGQSLVEFCVLSVLLVILILIGIPHLQKNGFVKMKEELVRFDKETIKENFTENLIDQGASDTASSMPNYISNIIHDVFNSIPVNQVPISEENKMLYIIEAGSEASLLFNQLKKKLLDDHWMPSDFGSIASLSKKDQQCWLWRDYETLYISIEQISISSQ
ncbi:MAG: hypothetical protein HYS98_00670 [Deltaproteobacteria bacterium]|nr:hypothetical protein [Deltaproteobacteria bacterium]